MCTSACDPPSLPLWCLCACVLVCREVEINVSTHAAGGLTMFDFILASKLDALDAEYSPKWLQQQQALMQQQKQEVQA